MSGEIAIQKDGGKAQTPARRIVKDWHPFRTMRELLRWDPFEEMAAPWPAFEGAAFAPDFDVKETKESFVFTADIPGVAEKDLQVELSGNRLSVSGKRESEKTEQGDTYYTTERSYGSFFRSFTLPDGVDSDKVKAELKNGVLNLTVPKLPQAQAKKISVSSK
jgi:HSP20 family protein